MPHLSAPLFGLFDAAPYQGTTLPSVASSASGAVKALRKRSAKLQALRALWREPLTMHQVSERTGWPLASVCSLKACLGEELRAVGQVSVTWPDGGTTQRTVWQVKA